jgi:hypothetical protein
MPLTGGAKATSDATWALTGQHVDWSLDLTAGVLRTAVTALQDFPGRVIRLKRTTGRW